MKSGKDYTVHSALTHFVGNEDYHILHGTNDFLAFMAESGAQNVDEKVWESFTLAKPMPPEMMPAVWWFAALLVFMLFEIVFQIMTFKMALASAKESRMADNNIRRDGTV